MSKIDTPDYDIDREQYAERGESSITVEWPVVIEERISTDWEAAGLDAEMKEYGDSYTEISHEGTYIEHQRLGNSLVNFDAYLDPSATVLVDAPDEWVLEGTRRKRNATEPPHRVAKRAGEPELRFDLYQHELVEAAKQRAAEDSTHHLRVLAEWFYRAAPVTETDAYNEYDIDVLRTTLHAESQETPHVDWVVDWGGDPDDWRHDIRPLGSYGADDETLAETLPLHRELRLYHVGGVDAVREARDAELGVER